MKLFRGTIFHTPHNPFSLEPGDPRALVAYDDGALLVDAGRIVACGSYDNIHSTHPHAETIDRRDGVLIPGLVDAHTHFPQLRIVGTMGRGLLDWLDHVALPEEARMADRDYAAATARRFLHALAAHGTTTALVFGAHFPSAMDEFFKAASESGLRIASGLVLSDRLLRPDLHLSVQRAYSASTALIRQYHGSGRLSYAVTPRFALSTSEEMLEMCGQLMAEHGDVRFQTHINEHPAELAEVFRMYPWAADYLAIYDRYHLNTTRSALAHNVHATQGEIERLAAAGAVVVHCPASNIALGSGCFPLRRHVAAGVTCALGTDVGAGFGPGMLKEGLHAYAVQRMAPDPMTLDAARLLYLATRAGASAVGLDGDIGDFTTGKAADFVYLRPPAGSVLESAMRHADSAMQVLSAVFTIAGQEAIQEVRVEGAVVFTQSAEAQLG